MNTAKNPDDIRQSLRLWDVQPPIDPAFRPGTWRRIERARAGAATWSAYLRLHAAGWSLAFVVGAGAAGAAGHWIGRTHEAADRAELLASYVAAIDARAMAGAASTGGQR